MINLVQIDMSITLDNDGLLRKECPVCEQQFKVFVEDNIDIDEGYYYCPVCGIPSSPNSFFTKEQIAHATDLAYSHMVEQINKSLGGLSRKMRGSKSVKFTFKPLKKNDPRTIVESSDFDEVVLDCCNEHIFIFSPITYKVIYCPKCGELNFPY